MPLQRNLDPATLKDAIAQLVERAGGGIKAAEIIGISPSRVSRWSDPSETDEYPSVARVMLLETAAGAPIVTRYLAERQGCVVTPMEDGAGDVTMDFAHWAEASARATADYAQALADRKIERGERDRIIRDLRAVIERAGEMVRDLTGGG